MGKLSCAGIRKSFGDVEVLKGVGIEAEEGELLVLLGPSGCGKSTLLRIIAGLETLDAGKVMVDADDISFVHPRERNIAMVFQNYALFPLMTVRENMSFGMRINKVPPAEIESKVKATAETLGIAELLERRPAQLSGGQRQRVAMGRAMVRDPRLFLFDEPLSNLDAKLRARMRVEIKELQQQIQVTTVYVTHDQMEAMTMADKLVVMREGEIEQVGPPKQVYESPASIYVASFLGSPEINLIDAEISADGKCSAGGVELPLPESGAASGKAVYGIRPHDMDICSPDQPGAIAGKVLLTEETGNSVIVHLQLASGAEITVQDMSSTIVPSKGEQAAARVNSSRIHLFDPTSGMRLAQG